MPTRPLAVVPLAPGFEEIEAVTIIDVLRRADVRVIVAALEGGSVAGNHDIRIEADCTLDELASCAGRIDLVVLPGGMPGARNLKDDERVRALLRDVAAAGGRCAALCAAPIALAPAGLAAERTLTCFPGFEKDLAEAHCVTDRVVIDDRVITGRGPGAALEFALTLVAELQGEERARELETAMIAGEHPRPLRV